MATKMYILGITYVWQYVCMTKLYKTPTNSISKFSDFEANKNTHWDFFVPREPLQISSLI